VGYLLIAPVRDADKPKESDIYAAVSYGGVFFFLYPEIQQLQDQTGELIDAQQSAFFIGPNLDLLEHFLVRARANAVAQPDHWQQRVGRDWHQPTSREQVLSFLERLESAIKDARRAKVGVLFLGT
jgi:hypothetical protein